MERAERGRVLDLRRGPPRAAALSGGAGPTTGGLASAGELPRLRLQWGEPGCPLHVAASGIRSILYCTIIPREETKPVNSEGDAALRNRTLAMPSASD